MVRWNGLGLTPHRFCLVVWENERAPNFTCRVPSPSFPKKTIKADVYHDGYPHFVVVANSLPVKFPKACVVQRGYWMVVLTINWWCLTCPVNEKTKTIPLRPWESLGSWTICKNSLFWGKNRDTFAAVAVTANAEVGSVLDFHRLHFRSYALMVPRGMIFFVDGWWWERVGVFTLFDMKDQILGGPNLLQLWCLASLSSTLDRGLNSQLLDANDKACVVNSYINAFIVCLRPGWYLKTFCKKTKGVSFRKHKSL